jgi:hypothetical protein
VSVPHDAEWERWRGAVDTKLDSIPSQVAAHVQLLSVQLGRAEENINGQFTEVRRRLGEVEHQTRLTNGTVRDHTVELAELRGEERGVESEVEHRRYTLKTLVGAVAAACTSLGALATFLTLVHVI